MSSERKPLANSRGGNAGSKMNKTWTGTGRYRDDDDYVDEFSF